MTLVELKRSEDRNTARDGCSDNKHIHKAEYDQARYEVTDVSRDVPAALKSWVRPPSLDEDGLARVETNCSERLNK